MITTGSDFSGVGAFEQALIRLGLEYKTAFACDMDKYARQTYVLNYGEPFYYPENVYDRAIPTNSLDVYMTSPPCQAFSFAGKRKGEDDKRGVLFYNSHEFIKQNNPRHFIFENVKGLLSDDAGKTFQKWIDLLAGKSVNGNPVIFPNDDAVPYHIYYQVLNAKHYGVPQNRERIFIIGIRDDVDNNFTFPKPFTLVKRLKDVLENDVDEKYFLSDTRITTLLQSERHIGWTDTDSKQSANCILTTYAKIPTDGEYLKVKSATLQGYEIATENDSVMIGAIRGRNPENHLDRTTGAPTEQTLELNYNGTSNALTTVQKDNVVVIDMTNDYGEGQRHYNKYAPSLRSERFGLATEQHNKIRRLTPRECFRLMDFPDSFRWPVSDSQAYKQSGNSIVVNCLVEIIKKLNLNETPSLNPNIRDSNGITQAGGKTIN